jgi:hypothetical protein
LKETINLDDTPNELMDLSAAVRNTDSINLHRTGSKECCEPANIIQISGKKLNCDLNCNKNTGYTLQQIIKDDELNLVSYDQLMNQPKEISFQIIKTNNLDDNPNILINLLAALPNTDSTNLHRTGSKGKYKQALILLLSGKNIVCGNLRKESSKEIRISLNDGEVLKNLI